MLHQRSESCSMYRWPPPILGVWTVWHADRGRHGRPTIAAEAHLSLTSRARCRRLWRLVPSVLAPFGSWLLWMLRERVRIDVMRSTCRFYVPWKIYHVVVGQVAVGYPLDLVQSMDFEMPG